MADITSLYRQDLQKIEQIALEIAAVEPVASVLLFQLVEAVLYEYEGGAVPGERARQINALAGAANSLVEEPRDAACQRDLAAGILSVFPRFSMRMSA
jgi:hypothetical protein